MEFRVLGKVEVLRDGDPVDLGAFRQRALLALLLTAPNSVFSTDQILDELWGDAGGVDKQNALWVYVSGLRKALEPDREKRTEGSILLTRAPGYLIAAGSEQIDSLQFERMVAEGRALADIDPAAASLVLAESLALWRGRPFEDFTYESFAEAEIARLEALRLEAVELRVDADLERGLARELISELESLVRQHPLREHLTAQLMLALHRSSRQAEALRAYQILKSRLGDELGIEPSSQLRKLEERIVIGDAGLELTPPAAVHRAPTVPGPAVRGYELREPIGAGATGKAYRAYQPAVGREVAIKVIRPDLANDPAFIRRFQTETQVIATLEHPHIVPLYDYWREPDAAYLVMRLMRGGNLASALDDGALTSARTMTMIDQLGDALQTMHRSGIAHGNLDSTNVLLDDESNAYISDVGIGVGAAAGEIATSSDIASLGVLVAQALTGRVDDVEALRESLPESVVRVVDRAIDVDGAEHYSSVGDLVGDLRAALGVAAGSQARESEPVDNPFKGLRAFDAVDADDFFGRERLVERLIARLGLSGSRGRFIAVVGPSGSGKSSVVKAGLLPAIRRGAVSLSGSWFTIEMTPGTHPFEQLEDALLGVAVDPPPSLLEQLAGARGLQRTVNRVLPRDGSQLLLLIDQFEELYTQVDPATANHFLDSLVSAVTDDQSRVRVIATLRADFYDRPLQHRGLGELLREGTEIVTPMTPHELERAITSPVEPLGITFEPALVASLVREVTDRPGGLPLLQYTLTELFDDRRGDRIAYATYEALGGVSAALVKRAEGLLASLGDDADEVARQVFLRLVTFNEGGEETRRRVLRSELEDLPVDRRILRSVLDTFGRHRLISFDRDPITRSPTVEISHEALLTEWTRLRDWIDGARHDVGVQRRLAEAIREWIAADRVASYLLRGGLLEQVHGWAMTTSLRLSAPEQAFLDASRAERDREAEQLVERERRAVVAERRQKARSRQLIGVGLVTLLIAAVGVFGAVQWRSAAEAKRDVDDLLTVNRLVTASRDQLDEDPELALLLAMQSLRQTVDLGYATEEAVDAVHFALQELGVQYDVDPATPVAARPGSQGPVGVYALSPNALMALAESARTRDFTDGECRTFLSGSCPASVDVPDDFELRGGMGAYGAGVGPRQLEGTTVTVFPGVDPDLGLLREFAEFKKRTGINVELTTIEAEAAASSVTEEPNHRPDILVFQGPIPEWALARAVDIGEFVDPATLRSDFGEYLLSFGTSDTFASGPAADGAVRAIPLIVGLKGLVFYPKAEFEKAGYEVPATWDELIALSDRIVADGGTPWCFGFESGVASGWPGTDLLESLVLRVGDTEAFDEWTRGDIGFTSPAVMEAGRLANELVFTPGYVRGGPAAISDGDWRDQLLYMFARDSVTDVAEPECWLHFQAEFMMNFRPEGAELGRDLDFFVLPAVHPDQPNATIGGAGGLASAVVDRPEVRAFMEFAASPDWGRYWAAEPTNIFTSPNRRFDLANYGDVSLDPGVVIRRELAEASQAAQQANTFRGDASDLMPTEIGGETLEGGPGAFYQAMLDWVDGVRTIDEALADIDAQWAALKAKPEG